MSTTTNPTIQPYASPRRPTGGSRINLRMVLFIAAIAVPFLAIGYVLVSQMVTGGIIRHGDYAEVNLRALGSFPFDQRGGALSAVPTRYRELDGKRVGLTGYMVSDRIAAGAGADFQVVYDVQKCCFGGPPQVQERVFCKAGPGKKVDLYSQSELVNVMGTLHVRLVTDESGAILSVYDLDVESVNPV